MITGACPYCKNRSAFSADITQWKIHLAGHREKIIEEISDISESCVICSYSNKFTNKTQSGEHLRWHHKRKEIIDWAVSRLLQKYCMVN